jgi:hypothetical protein
MLVLEIAEVLLAGSVRSVQVYTSGFPWGSTPTPSKVTVVLIATVRFCPAKAIGTVGGLVVIATVDGVLLFCPS